MLAVGCQPEGSGEKSLSALKEEFQSTILDCELEEGPFSFNYQYRTTFYSDKVVCLFGELTVVDRLPRGWKQYDSKVLYKEDKSWKEVTLENLLPADQHREQLRVACEEQLKRNPLSYFAGESPLYQSLELDDSLLFVVDSHDLVIIFPPYSVGSSSDGPFTVKIPLRKLKDEWGVKHPLLEHVSRVVESNHYIASCEPAS